VDHTGVVTFNGVPGVPVKDLFATHSVGTEMLFGNLFPLLQVVFQLAGSLFRIPSISEDFLSIDVHEVYHLRVL